MGRNYRLPGGRQDEVRMSEGIGTPGTPEVAANYDAPEPILFSGTRQIPYRGTMHHGVPFTPDGKYAADVPVEYLTGEDERATVTISTDVEIPPSDPIPVRVIQTPSPQTRKLFSVSTVFLPNDGQPVRITGQQRNRTKLRIESSAPANAIMPERQVVVPGLPGGNALATNQVGSAIDLNQYGWPDIQAMFLYVPVTNITGGSTIRIALSTAPQPDVDWASLDTATSTVASTMTVQTTKPPMRYVRAEIRQEGGAAPTFNYSQAYLVVRNNVPPQSAAGTTWLANHESVNAMTGYPLSDGKTFETTTDDDVWAMCQSSERNGALLRLLTEYSVEVA